MGQGNSKESKEERDPYCNRVPSSSSSNTDKSSLGNKLLNIFYSKSTPDGSSTTSNPPPSSPLPPSSSLLAKTHRQEITGSVKDDKKVSSSFFLGKMLISPRRPLRQNRGNNIGQSGLAAAERSLDESAVEAITLDKSVLSLPTPKSLKRKAASPMNDSHSKFRRIHVETASPALKKVSALAFVEEQSDDEESSAPVGNGHAESLKDVREKNGTMDDAEESYSPSQVTQVIEQTINSSFNTCESPNDSNKSVEDGTQIDEEMEVDDNEAPTVASSQETESDSNDRTDLNTLPRASTTNSTTTSIKKSSHEYVSIDSKSHNESTIKRTLEASSVEEKENESSQSSEDAASSDKEFYHLPTAQPTNSATDSKAKFGGIFSSMISKSSLNSGPLVNLDIFKNFWSNSDEALAEEKHIVEGDANGHESGSNGNKEESNGDVEETNGDVEDTNGDVEDTNGNVEDSNGDIEDSNGDVEETNGDVENCNGGVEDSNGDVEDSNGDVEETNGEVEDSNGGVEDSNGDVENCNGDVANSNGDIEDFKGDIEDSNGDVEKINGDIEESNGDVEKINGDVEETEESQEKTDVIEQNMDPDETISMDEETINLEDINQPDDEINDQTETKSSDAEIETEDSENVLKDPTSEPINITPDRKDVLSMVTDSSEFTPKRSARLASKQSRQNTPEVKLTVNESSAKRKSDVDSVCDSKKVKVVESLREEDSVDDNTSESTKCDAGDSEDEAESTLELPEEIALLDSPDSVEYVKSSKVVIVVRTNTSLKKASDLLSRVVFAYPDAPVISARQPPVKMKRKQKLKQCLTQLNTHIGEKVSPIIVELGKTTVAEQQILSVAHQNNYNTVLLDEQLSQQKIETETLPFCHCWFLNETDSIALKSLYSQLIKGALKVEAFKRDLLKRTKIQSDAADDIISSFTPNNTVGGTDILHCTAKGRSYEDSSYCIEKQENLGSVTQLMATSLVVTPRTFGIRVKLNESQLALWGNDDSPDTPVDINSLFQYQKEISDEENDEQELVSEDFVVDSDFSDGDVKTLLVDSEQVHPPAFGEKGCRAHITLGCSKEIHPRTTGYDVLLAAELEKTCESVRSYPISGGTLKGYGEGVWVIHPNFSTKMSAIFSGFHL